MNQRIIDKNILIEYTRKSCCVGGCKRKAHGHHIKSKGSGGDDVDDNLIPLCDAHHTALDCGIHTIGLGKFLEKYGLLIDDESIKKLKSYADLRGVHCPV